MSRDEISALLDQCTKEDLAAFLLGKAERDADFESELFYMLGAPDRARERAALKDFIRINIRKNTHSGYIDWRDCDNICYAFTNMLDKVAIRLTDASCLIAFDGALEIFLTCVKLASRADSSSGMLTVVSDQSLELLEKACNMVAAHCDEKEKKQTYETLIKQSKNKIFEGWGEWNYILLRYAIIFLHAKNCKKLYDALDELYEKYGQIKFSMYYESSDKLIRYAAIQKLDGDFAAEKFLMQNIGIDEMRFIAIERAMDKGDFGFAEKLCREKIEAMEEKSYYGRVPEWFYLLYNVYEKSQNKMKQIEEARAILFGGDVSYYNVLKELYQESGMWEKEYRPLLTALNTNLSSFTYMQIIKNEQEWSLLLEGVKKSPSFVFTYGECLADRYKNDIFPIYRAEIEKEASNAMDRRQYREVCKSLEQFFDAGGGVIVFDMIAGFCETYKRRPAMLDELDKLRKKLRKTIE